MKLTSTKSGENQTTKAPPPNNSKWKTKKSYAPLPDGLYTLKVGSIEYKATKKGDGKYAHVTFNVSSGQFTGRKIFQNFILEHPSEKAVYVGEKQFTDMLRAFRIELNDYDTEVTNSNFNLDREIESRVGTEENPGFKPQNKVLSFSP